MVIIHTSDDILRVLRENPEWKEAVRREILTEELMNLPARFDQFAAKTEQFIDEQRQFNENQRQFNERAEQFMDSTGRAIDRLRRDTGNMRASHARVETARDAGGIAHDMGFTIIRTLTSDDLLAMVRNNDTADLADGDLRSFRLADLVVEASDQKAAIHLIAVEISYTADERDSNRALRNARLLTRFTGHPAHAAVASIRNDDRIREVVESGQVYWHRLEDRDPDPE